MLHPFAAAMKNAVRRTAFSSVAEGQGFEPWLPVEPAKRFSRPPHSTTLPPLRGMCDAWSLYEQRAAGGCGNPLGVWRRDRDLNPGYPFGLYTISNRAPSASSDISPHAFWPRFSAQQNSIHDIPLFTRKNEHSRNRDENRHDCHAAIGERGKHGSFQGWSSVFHT